MHCIHDITPTISQMPSTISVSSQDSIDVLRTTLCMISHPLYVCQLMHSTQPHIHSLWLQTIVVITLHPLHSWHHTPYIGHHTHAIQTLYLPSNPLYLTLHPLYLCHQKQGINYTTKTLCMISHRLYVWHHIQYACYQNYCLWNHTHCV